MLIAVRTIRLLILVVAAALALAGAARAQDTDPPTVVWDAGGDATSWDDPANWAPNEVPGGGDVVAIPDVEATTRVVIDGAIAAVTAVDVHEQLAVAGPEAILSAGRVTAHRDLVVAQGAVHDTMIVTPAGSAVLVGEDAVFRRVQVDGVMRKWNGIGDLTVYGNLEFDGLIEWLPIAFVGERMALTGTAEVSANISIGAGELVIGSGIRVVGTSSDWHVFGGCTSTCGATVINRGTIIGKHGIRLGAPGQQFINESVITAVSGWGSGTTLDGSWTNDGTIVVEDAAVLTLAGAFRAGDIGAVVRRGGRVVLTGHLDNEATTLDLTDSLGGITLGTPWHFSASPPTRYVPPLGTIVGGTVLTDEGAPLLVERGLVDGVHIQGLVRFQPDGWLHVSNGLRIDGEARQARNTDGFLAGAVIYARGTQAFSGDATVEANIQLATDADVTITQGLHLAGAVGPTYLASNTRLVNEGLITTRGLYPHDLVNVGTIRVPWRLTLDEWQNPDTGARTTWINRGQIVVGPGGELALRGNYRTAQIGDVDATAPDASVEFRESLDNRGATLDLSRLGRVKLYGTITGGAIAGGELRATSESLTPTPSLGGVHVEATAHVKVYGQSLDLHAPLQLDGTIDVTGWVTLHADRIEGTGTLFVRSYGSPARGQLTFGERLVVGRDLTFVLDGEVRGGELVADGDLASPDAPWSSAWIGVDRLVVNGEFRVAMGSFGRVDGACVNNGTMVVAEGANFHCSSLQGGGLYHLTLQRELYPTTWRGRALDIAGVADFSTASLRVSVAGDPPAQVGTVMELLRWQDLHGWFSSTSTVGLADRSLQLWRFPDRLNVLLTPSLAPEQTSTAARPNGPVITSVARVDGTIEVRWEPPENTGGLPLTAFLVYALREGTHDIVDIGHLSPTTHHATLAGFDNSGSYLVIVEAVTAAGSRGASRTVSPTPSPTPTPSPSPTTSAGGLPAGETPTAQPSPEPTMSPVTKPTAVDGLRVHATGRRIVASWTNAASTHGSEVQLVDGSRTPAGGEGVVYRGRPIETYRRGVTETGKHRTLSVRALDRSGDRSAAVSVTLRASRITDSYRWQRAEPGRLVARARVLDATSRRPVSGKVVLLQRQRRDGTFDVLRRVTTNAEGRVRATLRPRTKGEYRWRLPGQQRRLQATTARVSVRMP